MNIKTFKLFCLKAGTSKAKEIHEYYLKLEEILHETIGEESDELKLQLENKSQELENKSQQLELTIQELDSQEQKSKNEKLDLLEKTLISQFPVNAQCIYYGIIDNKTLGNPSSKMYKESVIKFGQSNHLEERIKCHKKNFTNFRLIAVFKVKNKIEIENCIKRHNLLKKRIRSIMIDDICYRELLALDEEEFTIEKMDKYIRDIIKENEYNIENYNLLLDKNDKLEDEIRKLQCENKDQQEKLKKIETEMQKIKSDPTTNYKEKTAGDITVCKYGYILYIFECEEMRYKCSIVRQKDLESLTTNLKSQDKDGFMRYTTKVSYSLSERIMTFLLKQSLTFFGNNKYEGTFNEIKKIIDITVKLECLLIDSKDDLDKFQTICETLPSEELNPEVPKVRKTKRSIDQINKETGEVVKTFESIEAAGRSIGLTTGTAIGTALREKRLCQGFLWRYSGISKEDQYSDQPVIKVCCSTGEKKYFKNIADSARDIGISAPGLRQRILTQVHLNDYHWIFDKNSSHYK